MQSNLDRADGLHVAIIMDGNGRWAEARGLPRLAGHRAGAETIRRVCKAAPSLGVATLTLFAFSIDNWRRPADEISALMDLLHQYVLTEVSALVEDDVRLTIIGRRDRLPEGLADEIAMAESDTANGESLHLRIAFDYSSRDAILQAAASMTDGTALDRAAFGRLIADRSDGVGDVDLLIRTGGEKRLSDFLLWESAYAELYFTDRMWPDFSGDDLAAALADFRIRERRFGGVPGSGIYGGTSTEPMREDAGQELAVAAS
jgi:undecaprenyl diphosphate synthase